MPSDRWRQIEYLYRSALEHGASVLMDADPDVRREVEAMLAQGSGAVPDQTATDRQHESGAPRLTPGSQLGPYRIEGLLGKGGMGQVFRARDPRLGRSVAIKISQQRFAERFEREAKAIAALNHPHICTLYDVGSDYLVMEYIDGKPLAGPLPLEKVLEYAGQICDALDYAHRSGIVHRDLKPSNIMVTRQGVKLLDFGIARTCANEETLTATGEMVGTPQYMAPELWAGKPGDARSDIFALGSVLREMAVGTGTAKTLEPPALERVVQTCQAHDPEDRWQSVREVKLALEMVRISEPAASAKRSRLQWAVTAAAIAAAILFAALWLRQSRPRDETGPIISQIEPPAEAGLDENWPLTPLLSPDGRRIAFLANWRNEKQLLWVRALDSTTATPLEGSEGAFRPFWSPDGRSLGFFARGKLKKIEISGGLPTDVCDVLTGLGGSWAADGTIVFSPASPSQLFRVSASGGRPVPAFSLDAKRKEVGQDSPQFLPDNRHFLYHSGTFSAETGGIYLGSLDGGDPRLLLAGVSNAIFAPPDHIVFSQGGALIARRFDLSRYQFSGDSAIVAKPPGTGDVADLSAARNGMLAFVAGASAAGERIEWFSRDGKPQATFAAAGMNFTPRISPDGSQIALTVAPPDSPARDIWVFDQSLRTERRLTFDQLHNWTPVWSPDGSRIAYSSVLSGKYHIYARAADGSGARQALLEDDASEHVDSWSSDGKYIAYRRFDPSGRSEADLWVLPLFGDRKPFPIVESHSNKQNPTFSPDGRWLAYDSDESGRWEVYIVGFPQGEGKWQVSTGGGQQPRWRRDGRELFFLATGNKLMAAEVREKAVSPEIGAPQSLFQITPDANPYRSYDVTGDGKKFVVVTHPPEQYAKAITIISNWTALLEKK